MQNVIGRISAALLALVVLGLMWAAIIILVRAAWAWFFEQPHELQLVATAAMLLIVGGSIKKLIDEISVKPTRAYYNNRR